MRAFVFLLILANLAFAAWTHGYIPAGSSPDALRVQRQFNPEQLRIVARDEPPPLVEKNGKAERVEKPVAKLGKEDDARDGKPAEFCLKADDVPAEAAVGIVETLNEKWPAVRVQRTAQPGSASFWVFIPPQPSRKDAENKAAELKKLGVPEFYIVQDGAQARAISLGVFSSKEAAKTRLEQLRGKGVRSAKVGERPGKPPLFEMSFSGPEAQADAVRSLLVERAAGITVETCKGAP